MNNSIEVSKDTNWSVGHIREPGVSQNYLEGRTEECTIVFVIVTGRAQNT